jgi:hypothetical protein
MADAAEEPVTIDFVVGDNMYEIEFTYNKLGKDTLNFTKILIKKNNEKISDLRKIDNTTTDERVYIKNIVSAGGDKKERDSTEEFLREKIVNYDKESILTRYIRGLLRNKFPRNYTLQFKHSKKLNVKKTKSRSKSLRKSLRKSKPRRKVKSPKPKKV